MSVFGTYLGYAQHGAWAANVLTGSSWATTGGGQVTFTTTSAHGVAIGQTFTISGCTPAGYNGTYVAIAGTSGSTLVASLATNPGAISVEGTLNASLQASTALAVPAGARSAVIGASQSDMRYLDGAADPTATVGMPLSAGGSIDYQTNVRNLRFILQDPTSTNGTLNVLYYQ